MARLAVYRNNVVSSLIDAVADTFPVTQELVGEEFFRAMASVFVRQHPPRSRVLAHYGAGFAAFVDGFDPARSVPYLADVARLERARVVAYHAADADPLTAETLGVVMSSGGDLSALQLICHPTPWRAATGASAHTSRPEGLAGMVTAPIRLPPASPHWLCWA